MELIDETTIKNVEIYGSRPNQVLNQLKKLVDLIFGNSKSSSIDYDFFDIKGSALLYGIPGVGKTTIVNSVLGYALDKYGIDSYQIYTSDIIEADLGQTVRNFHRDAESFRVKDGGILFIDEIDKFCVNRSNPDEIAEMKRLLIELMGFIDAFHLSDRKMIIGCTNVLNQLDEALIRRFSICEEIESPAEEEKVAFANLCLQKVGINKTIISLNPDVSKKWNTFDAIKNHFRSMILSGKSNDIYALIAEKETL